MAQFDDLMQQIPIDQLARSLGVDRAQAEQAVRSAIPALVGGMQANAEDPAGARSLAGALSDHAQGGVPTVDDVDTNDGQKIVQNVFGGNTDNVISALGGQAGGSDLMSKLLPMLAPIIMSLIARQMAGGGGLGSIFGGGSGASSGGGGAAVGGTIGSGMAPGAPSAAGGGGLGGLTDMLGSILGGGAGGAKSGGSGGGLDDILGGVLGGMLGGGKR